MPPTQKHRHAAIDTLLKVDSLLLKTLTGREELGRLFTYHAVLLDPEQDVDPDSLIGTGTTVRLELENGGTRYFNGFFSTIAFSGYENGMGVYHAEIVPWTWFLTRSSDCRCFQDQTVEQILTAIFKIYGFTDYKFKLKGTYKPRVFTVQYNETDFNFISRIMEHEGIYYYYKHENGKHTMVIVDEMSCHHPHPQRGPLEYHRKSGVLTDGYLFDMTFQKTVATGGYALNDYNFKQPKLDLRADKQQEKKHAASKLEIFEFPGSYRDKEEGKKLAKMRIEEIQAGHETVHACATARGLACGYIFELIKAERKDQNREYLITGTNITIQSDAYSPGGGSTGDKFHCEVTALPKSKIFRPARLAQKPQMKGPHTGLVVGPPGEEIYCDEHGRVKVHFYWDRYSKGNEKSSKWVRVSQAAAGGGYGFLSLPRIGEEVLVEFINGDPDRPVIIGRLYNNDNKPPYALPADKNRAVWRSNTTKGGGGAHEIRLDDTKGKEQIYIHSERDLDIRVKKTYREWIGKDRHSIVIGDEFTYVTKDAHRKVGGKLVSRVKGKRFAKIGGDDVTSAQGEIQHHAGMDLLLDSGKNMHTKSTLNTSIEAGMNVTVDAGIMITLSAGGSFISIGPAGVAISGPMVLINSGGAKGALVSVAKKALDIVKKAKAAATSIAGKIAKALGMGHAKNPLTWKTTTVHDIAHRLGDAFIDTAKKVDMRN